MSVDPNNVNYVREVTDLFTARCRNPATLTPDDFAIIAEWHKQEIPLEVILKSIGEVCDGHCENKLSVTDIQDKVKRDFVNWLQTS
ncbi:MAG: hypothetical protein ACKVRN_11570 [Pyrinomonadaceae bacterium]